MPSIDQNIEEWDKNYNWPEKGDEWSSAWGGSDSLWLWVILPRIIKYLKVPSILEIAPGYGRFTNYLKNYCNELSVVDLSGTCIDYCKKRFQADNNIKYFVNDGKSLDCIPDNSIDFVFTFDSLVHAEADVIEEYIKQISKKLAPNGVAFIHHSDRSKFPSVNRFLFDFRPHFITRKSHWRAKTVSADLFKQFTEKYDCSCITQELINWGGPYLIDCLSTFTLKDSKFKRETIVSENYSFMKEAKIISKISKLY